MRVSRELLLVVSPRYQIKLAECRLRAKRDGWTLCVRIKAQAALFKNYLLNIYPVQEIPQPNTPRAWESLRRKHHYGLDLLLYLSPLMFMGVVCTFAADFLCLLPEKLQHCPQWLQQASRQSPKGRQPCNSGCCHWQHRSPAIDKH